MSTKKYQLWLCSADFEDQPLSTFEDSGQWNSFVELHKAFPLAHYSDLPGNYPIGHQAAIAENSSIWYEIRPVAPEERF